MVCVSHVFNSVRCVRLSAADGFTNSSFTLLRKFMEIMRQFGLPSAATPHSSWTILIHCVCSVATSCAHSNAHRRIIKRITWQNAARTQCKDNERYDKVSIEFVKRKQSVSRVALTALNVIYARKRKKWKNSLLPVNEIKIWENLHCCLVWGDVFHFHSNSNGAFAIGRAFAAPWEMSAMRSQVTAAIQFGCDQMRAFDCGPVQIWSVMHLHLNSKSRLYSPKIAKAISSGSCSNDLLKWIRSRLKSI